MLLDEKSRYTSKLLNDLLLALKELKSQAINERQNVHSWLSNLSNEKILSPSSSLYDNKNVLLNIKKKLGDINTLFKTKEKEIQSLELSSIENEKQIHARSLVISHTTFNTITY